MQLCRQRDRRATERIIEKRVIEGRREEAEKLVIPVDLRFCFWLLLTDSRIQGAHDIRERVVVCAGEALELRRMLGMERI